MKHNFAQLIIHKPVLILVGFLAITAFTSGVLAAPEDVRLDLFIELKAPEHVEPGGEYAVNISYGNSNTARTPADTWVEASLPTGVQFVSAKDKHNNPLPPDSTSGGNLHWDVGTPIPDWETEHITILLAVDEGLSQNSILTVTAEIGTTSAEVTLDNNTAAVTSYTCDMAGSYKQAHAYELMPLDVITYTITLSLAQGSSPGFQDVTLVDTLPPAHQVRFLGWTSSEQGTYEGSQLRWQGRVHSAQPTVLQYQLGIEADVPQGSLLSNQAHLAWWDSKAGTAREFELDPANVQVSMADNVAIIGSQGGVWQPATQFMLTVPPLAVQQDTRFQYEAMFVEEPPISPTPGWFYAGIGFKLQAFQFGEVAQFDQPLEITMQLDEKLMSGLQSETMQLWQRANPAEDWQPGPELIFTQEGLISFQCDHLTEFAIFAQGAYRVHLPVITHK